MLAALVLALLAGDLFELAEGFVAGFEFVGTPAGFTYLSASALNINSTRLFCALPSGVLLVASGCVSPRPSVESLVSSILY